jgi:hypothetical protein
VLQPGNGRLYIAQRNGRRQDHPYILQHQRYSQETDAGTQGFGGIRQMGSS